MLPLLLRSGSVSLSGSSCLIFVLTFTLKLFFVLESTAVCHHHHVLFFCLDSIFSWDTHASVTRAACTCPSVLVGGWLLLVGWNVGLLIFRPDAQVLPGGLSPHRSRWHNTLQSVTPSHTLQGIHCVCLCASHA